MRWAMAMDDPFAAFDADFGAVRTPLYNNYRSSPDLVRIQHVLAKALDRKTVRSRSRRAEATIAGDSCAIWDFQTPDIEAAASSRFHRVGDEGPRLGPRDFVLLVRQKRRPTTLRCWSRSSEQRASVA